MDQTKRNSLASSMERCKGVGEQAGAYLAGLWEGDGHITCPRFDKEGRRANTPSFHITFKENQLPLVKVLVSSYGGYIREKKKENAIVWSMSRREHLVGILSLLNGFIRSPKIYQFNILLSYLNAGIAQPNDCSPLDSNYWLAGFIDADGSFQIRVSEKRKRKGTFSLKKRVGVRFSLEQQKFHKKTAQPFQPLFANIADFLQVNLNTSKHNSREYWSIESTVIKKLQKLVDYLERYPLLTSKNNSYQLWLEAFYLIKENLHLTEKGLREIVFIKEHINSKQSVFLWNHLLHGQQCTVPILRDSR